MLPSNITIKELVFLAFISRQKDILKISGLFACLHGLSLTDLLLLFDQATLIRRPSFRFIK